MSELVDCPRQGLHLWTLVGVQSPQEKPCSLCWNGHTNTRLATPQAAAKWLLHNPPSPPKVLPFTQKTEYLGNAAFVDDAGVSDE